MKPSGREGPLGRSFHCKITPLKGSGAGRIKYIHGVGETRDDVLLSDDKIDVDELVKNADIAEAKRHDQPMRRASAYSIVIELPRRALLLTESDLRKLGNTLAEETGKHAKSRHNVRAVTWAIHDDERTHKNPHLHIVRMVDPIAEKLIDGPRSMVNFRQAIADQINEIIPEARWHGGTLADTGIKRVAKKRLPMAVYKAREEVERDREAGKAVAPKRSKLAQAAQKIEHGWDQELKQAQEARIRRADKLGSSVRNLGGVGPQWPSMEAARRIFEAPLRVDADQVPLFQQRLKQLPEDQLLAAYVVTAPAAKEHPDISFAGEYIWQEINRRNLLARKPKKDQSSQPMLPQQAPSPEPSRSQPSPQRPRNRDRGGYDGY